MDDGSTDKGQCEEVFVTHIQGWVILFLTKCYYSMGVYIFLHEVSPYHESVGEDDVYNRGKKR